MTETITAIDPMPSNPNVLRVRVDGRIIARLSRADVDALELAEGQHWTAKRAAGVQQALDAAKARKAAFAMLGRRALSRGELIQRLEDKGHERKIVSAVADQLDSDGWIDDLAYARGIVHELVRKKPASGELLMQKMQARKIDDATARKVIKEVAAESDPMEEAVEFASKRLRSMASLPRVTAARRIAGALARRGFDEETIVAVVERLKIVPEDR